MPAPVPAPSRVLLLASQSPRRRALLEAAAVPLVLVPPGPEHEDLVPASATPAERAEWLAREKARGADCRAHTGLLLASDTVVALGARCYGKPRDAAEARSFLEELEGREHEVWSAIAFGPVTAGQIAVGELASEVHGARVRFRAFGAGELERYLATGEWRDKAGGYGIQAAAGAFAELRHGDFDTVVGLPLQAVLGHWRRYLAGGARDSR